jgi:hypothetical protein
MKGRMLIPLRMGVGVSGDREDGKAGSAPGRRRSSLRSLAARGGSISQFDEEVVRGEDVQEDGKVVCSEEENEHEEERLERRSDLRTVAEESEGQDAGIAR